jgi:hypothetical protein
MTLLVTKTIKNSTVPHCTREEIKLVSKSSVEGPPILQRDAQIGTRLKQVMSSRECSVADPGCLSLIRIFPFRIPDPGSKRFRISDPDPHHRIQVFLTQKTGSKLSKKMIWNIHPGSRIRIFSPSRILGSKKHRIQDQQHCRKVIFKNKSIYCSIKR